MSRILLALSLTTVVAGVLAGCSRTDLREMAEGVRVQAEGMGADAELRRETARIAAMGDGGYGTAQVPAPAAPEPEKAAAAPEKARPAPTPVYVVVPAY